MPLGDNSRWSKNEPGLVGSMIGEQQLGNLTLQMLKEKMPRRLHVTFTSFSALKNSSNQVETYIVYNVCFIVLLLFQGKVSN